MNVSRGYCKGTTLKPTDMDDTLIATMEYDLPTSPRSGQAGGLGRRTKKTITNSGDWGGAWDSGEEERVPATYEYYYARPLARGQVGCLATSTKTGPWVMLT